MTLQALLFDVDGTLADTERDGHRIAFNQAFNEAGLDWNWSVELYGKLLAVTGGKERILHYLDNFNTDFKRPAALADYIAGLHKSKTKFYTKLLHSGAIPLRPGVLRILNEARAEKLRLAIVTTTTPANVSALLKNTLGSEGETWFEVIAAGDIVPAKKPASDIYDYTLREMNLSAEECMAFEDSENGIKASLAARLKTIITINAYTKEHDFNAASIILDCFGEPEQAFHLIAGNAHEKSYVDIELIKMLFDESQ